MTRQSAPGYSNPRNANGHRRRQLRRRVLAEETVCGICGQPVDKSLKTPHPGSPEVDEIIPISLGGDPLARANCQLAHRQPVQREEGQRDESQHTTTSDHTRDHDQTMANVVRGVTPRRPRGPLYSFRAALSPAFSLGGAYGSQAP